MSEYPVKNIAMTLIMENKSKRLDLYEDLTLQRIIPLNNEIVIGLSYSPNCSIVLLKILDGASVFNVNTGRYFLS